MNKRLPETTTTALALSDFKKPKKSKSKKADSYDIGSYAAHLALSDWGVGWDQISLTARRAVLTYYVVEILRGKIWADDVIPRQDPKDWEINDVHRIVKGFLHLDEKGLSFDSVRARAVQKRPKRGSTVECTESLLGGV